MNLFALCIVCNLISLKGIQLTLETSHWGPPLLSTTHCTASATFFALTWKKTKLHAINLEDICNVLEIIDCCENILIHFVN